MKSHLSTPLSIQGLHVVSFLCVAISSIVPLKSQTPLEVSGSLLPLTSAMVPAPAGAGQQRNAVVVDGDLSEVDWESLVNRSVLIRGDLVVVDTYDLIRRGQVKVARERLFIPTSRIDPNDKDPNGTSYDGGSNTGQVAAAQKRNDTATVILDDGTARQNIFPPKLFPGLGRTHPSVRIGSIVKGFSGRVVKAGNNLLLVSERPLNWQPAPRPERPSVGAADVMVASFNVLNYFTTVDNGSNNARGADSDSELKRQEAKLVSAILKLNADVVGLMELQNNVEAENRLVEALNRASGKDVYVGCGIPDGFGQAPGGQDAIRVGIIYRSDRVDPMGATSLIRDSAFSSARTPIVRTFRSKQGGKPFTVVVNHFKSKGGASDADFANKNKGDGQAAYNHARRAQALAICNQVNAASGRGAPRILVIGDLNAYQQEDPIDAFRANGFVDLHEQFADGSASSYSYVYYGQCGSLDHALATEGLAKDVTGVATWHINSDEPRFLDYNEEFNPSALYQDDPFRSSDHDPVLIGIRN